MAESPIVPPWYIPNAVHAHLLSHLQLNVVVQQPDLLTRLERRQTNVRAAIASKRIAKCAISAAADLALDCEVYLIEQIVGSKLHRVEFLVGVGALRCVFGFESLLHAAGAVFAGAATLAGLGAAFGGWSLLVGNEREVWELRTLDDRTGHVFFCDELVFVDQVVVLASDDRIIKVVAEVDKADARGLCRCRLG
jgi:hypothetical protein